MKKFMTLFLCAVMVLTLAACGNSGSNGGNKEGDTMDLTAMIDKLYEGISADNMPMVMTQEVPAEAFEGVFFIPAVEGAQGVMSEPMMSSVAWSVCLLRVADGTDVESVPTSRRMSTPPSGCASRLRTWT